MGEVVPHGCIELQQYLEQTRHVRRRSLVDDIEVVCRDGGALKHRRYTPDPRR
jgi:hypothetical protein